MKRYRLLHLPTSKFVLVNNLYKDYSSVQTFVNTSDFGLQDLWLSNDPFFAATEKYFLEFTNKNCFKQLFNPKNKNRFYGCIAIDLKIIETIEEYSRKKIPFSKDEFEIVEVMDETI